ncbi:MAG: hypothetical protein A3E78_04275 [Alphaproteobacteria bacterium RIFCSPHIGHO2_12_FULL_63_12]|nr:MAG: hypothetical protein A3E78_04275 [Alphaproteobacteria bacterium RIFCSPHIGHO2_12_FULL_63_12]
MAYDTIDLADVLARHLASMEALLSRGGVAEMQLRLIARNVTAGWEPLNVTFDATPLPDTVWVIDRLTLHGMCAVNPPNSAAPITGLFMIQRGATEDTLAIASGVTGWAIDARGVPLPAGVVVAYTLIPGAGYAYQISLTQSSPLKVYPGETLRAIINCNPTTAQPGPGAGSFGILTAMGSVRPTR